MKYYLRISELTRYLKGKIESPGAFRPFKHSDLFFSVFENNESCRIPDNFN